ncbi:Transcriptional regulators [Listeria grayi]|uniref:Transcriptional regulators n=1 Tax=Listeria grayi TaxID=1641 RepID=A0A378MCH9_LISGR|nr:GntR family transcriptional regulator [Listeria grayi]STY44001.1 Transcriptional regulators [Listeria grayi]
MEKQSKGLYSEKVYWTIIERIQAGQLQVGAALREEQIAKELDISRSPVRTAVAQLVAEEILVATDRGVAVGDILVTPARYKMLTEVAEAFLAIVIQKAPAENYNWSFLTLHSMVFQMRLLAADEDEAEFIHVLHLFLLELLRVSENNYFTAYSRRNFFLIEKFGGHLPTFNMTDTRLWVVHQLDGLLKQLSSDQTEAAVQTLRNLFRELQVQAYRI